MKRISLFAAGALALFSVSASATDHQVFARNSPRAFDPPTLQINVGDTVTFINDPDNPGFHNVKSDADAVTAFRCANGCDETGGNGNASQDPWTATVTFPTAGTAGFYCEIHGGDGGIGMSGVITIVNTGGSATIEIDPTTLAGAADEGASTTVPMAISNTGDADLDWTADTASTDCATPDVVPWLSLVPDNGTVVAGDPPTSVDVTLDATTLTPGVYNANVCVHSNDAANDLVSVPVAFTVAVSAADQIYLDGFDP